MASVSLHGRRFSYETEGDGFPLVLAPGLPGCWLWYMPLLGELCRTIAYVCHDETLVPHYVQTSALLQTFLDALELDRVYLASQAAGWPAALHFALQRPGRLEGLVLLGVHDAATVAVQDLAACEARLPEIAVPTLVLLDAEAAVSLPYAEVLSARVPHCTRTVVADTASASGTPTRQLAHTLLRFLLHCERQRNLVRGASFLL